MISLFCCANRQSKEVKISRLRSERIGVVVDPESTDGFAVTQSVSIVGYACEDSPRFRKRKSSGNFIGWCEFRSVERFSRVRSVGLLLSFSKYCNVSGVGVMLCSVCEKLLD